MYDLKPNHLIPSTQYLLNNPSKYKPAKTSGLKVAKAIRSVSYNQLI